MKTVAEFSQRFGLSQERIRTFCRTGRIPGAQLLGMQWLIPDEAVLPVRKNGRPGKPIPILPTNARETKTAAQKQFLASCSSAEENIARASPFRNATIKAPSSW
jgi:hypothetical protein